MIIVKVELWSAVTGKKTELARMEICNSGTNLISSKGNYHAATLVGRSTEAFNQRRISKSTFIEDWPRQARHVWNLVATALTEMGYGKEIK